MIPRTLLDNGIYYNLRPQLRQLRTLGLVDFARWNSLLLNAWGREKLNRHIYHTLDESELRTTRKSDTVFIFGSGYSLNDLSLAEWQHIAGHDTLGFSGFIYQDWVRVDYHLIRGWVELQTGSFKWREHTLDFVATLNRNSHFRDTIFIMQGEYMAQFCNTLIGYRLLRPKSRIFRFTTARAAGPPTRSFRQGLRHIIGTLCDVVNFAYCLGWREIVLVGVDLYDSRYFWLKPNETLGVDETTGMLKVAKHTTRGSRYDQTHNTANNGIVDIMGQWQKLFADDGIRLSVYNPRSLLAKALPLYQPNKSSLE